MVEGIAVVMVVATVVVSVAVAVGEFVLPKTAVGVAGVGPS